MKCDGAPTAGETEMRRSLIQPGAAGRHTPFLGIDQIDAEPKCLR